MQPDPVTGERRPVTALFADVVGSTSLAEQMDPEDWATTMEQGMAIMSAAVERYGGWVASHLGDGCMAIFGLPTAHEDDPARAVTAALEMSTAIDELGQQLQADGIGFRIRVGVNSGEVVLRDTVADGATTDPRIYGDTLNVAARMQSEAPPGGIMITAETYGLVSGLIETRHVGPVTVKGKAAAVEAYEVLGRTGALRAVRGLAGLSSPMVGRDDELARLASALGPVQAGLGRMGRILGEPGIGKSRLLAELRGVAEADDMGWVEARTVSYGRDIPLHLAIDLVRALTGLPDPLESIDPADASGRLTQRLQSLDGIDAAVTGPLLCHLLSLPLDEAGSERIGHMEPQTLRLRYAEAISELVAGAARAQPLVMVCDDVHWADDTSVDLLKSLMAAVPSRALLWVLASRTDRGVPGWRLITAADETLGDALIDVRLDPLEAEEGSRLVANLLEIESLPHRTREMILRRAEGNPLFVEEIIRMLIDRGAIEFREARWFATDRVLDVEVPETLQGLLLARIDRLNDDARRVLRVASVIGRSFPVSLLEGVGREEAAVEPRGVGAQLGTLEGAGLIALAAATPQLEYAFRHALIQDAAYASLLKQERRSLHLEVAEALLAQHPDQRDEHAAVLAHHFERAQDRARAIEYLTLAARQARSRFARQEALDFARRALALLPQDDEIEPAERALRAELRLLEAEAGAASVPLRDGLALLEGAIADADAIDQPATSARAWLLIVRARATSGEQHRSSPELENALDQADRLAHASGLPALMAKAMFAASQAHYMSSEFEEAAVLMEQAIPALIDAGDLYSASIAAGQLGTAYGHLSRFDEAVRWTDRAHELGLQSGDPNASLDADLGRSMVEAIRGDTIRAIEYATRAADMADRVDNKACALVAHSVIGEQHLRDGDAAQAAISFEASADLATFCQFMPVKIEQTELLLQTARARSGDGQVEFERYERALELARQFGDRLAEAQLHEQRAHDRIDAGQTDLAREDLSAAAMNFDALGATADLAQVRELESSLPA